MRSIKKLMVTGSILAATLAGTAGVASAQEPSCGWLNARSGIVGFNWDGSVIYGAYCPAYQPGWRHFSGVR